MKYIVLGLFVLLLGSVEYAVAAKQIYSNVQIRGYHGKCLDVRGPSSRNGTPVQLWC